MFYKLHQLNFMDFLNFKNLKPTSFFLSPLLFSACESDIDIKKEAGPITWLGWKTGSTGQ